MTSKFGISSFIRSSAKAAQIPKQRNFAFLFLSFFFVPKGLVFILLLYHRLQRLPPSFVQPPLFSPIIPPFFQCKKKQHRFEEEKKLLRTYFFAALNSIFFFLGRSSRGIDDDFKTWVKPNPELVIFGSQVRVAHCSRLEPAVSRCWVVPRKGFSFWFLLPPHLVHHIAKFDQFAGGQNEMKILTKRKCWRNQIASSLKRGGLAWDGIEGVELTKYRTLSGHFRSRPTRFSVRVDRLRPEPLRIETFATRASLNRVAPSATRSSRIGWYPPHPGFPRIGLDGCKFGPSQIRSRIGFDGIGLWSRRSLCFDIPSFFDFV